MKKMLSMILVAMMMALPMIAMAEADVPTPSPEVEATAEVTTEATAEAATEAAAEATTEEAATIANPFLTCTEIEAAEQLGATYTITAPEGFEMIETARLSDELIAQGMLPVVRVAYMMEDALYRVHITKITTPLAATESTVEVDANGTQAFYDAGACSITYAQGEYAITIDSADYTQEQLVATVGTVTVTPATATAETEAATTETLEATDAIQADAAQAEATVEPTEEAAE